MVEKIEDLQLPNAVVQRIIKDALPDGINVAKDARAEISKAASIFVLYLTATARHQLHLRNQKKTLTVADILQALEVMEMENFVEPLKKAMEQHKRQQKNKKDRKGQASDTAATESPAIVAVNEAETEPPPDEIDTEKPLETEETIPESLDTLDEEQLQNDTEDPMNQ